MCPGRRQLHNRTDIWQPPGGLHAGQYNRQFAGPRVNKGTGTWEAQRRRKNLALGRPRGRHRLRNPTGNWQASGAAKAAQSNWQFAGPGGGKGCAIRLAFCKPSWHSALGRCKAWRLVRRSKRVLKRNAQAPGISFGRCNFGHLARHLWAPKIMPESVAAVCGVSLRRQSAAASGGLRWRSAGSKQAVLGHRGRFTPLPGAFSGPKLALRAGCLIVQVPAPAHAP